MAKTIWEQTARGAAVLALSRQAARWPQLVADGPDPEGLSDADRRLAEAIYGTTVRRWLTLRAALDPRVKGRSLTKLEPALQAVLLAGAAQLLLLDGLPDYAVVDQSVEVGVKAVRSKAAPMINAVLRRLAREAELVAPLLEVPPPPDDGAGLDEVGLSTAASVPVNLLRAWAQRHGEAESHRLAVHAMQRPPVIVAVGPDAGGLPTPEGVGFEGEAHDWEGFAVWTGTHAALVDWLTASGAVGRVQDPAASLAVAATADLAPRRVLDYCAGRGTKTRQLQQLHPSAEVLAWDTDPQRREALAELDDVAVLSPGCPSGAEAAEGVDLLVLDVPCSNTGTLARRPEARYRYSDQALGQLTQLQRQIIAEARPRLAPGGHLLYSTCSIDKAENHNQVRRLVQQHGLELLDERLTLPGGSGTSYHDGAYHALLRRP